MLFIFFILITFCLQAAEKKTCALINGSYLLERYCKNTQLGRFKAKSGSLNIPYKLTLNSINTSAGFSFTNGCLIGPFIKTDCNYTIQPNENYKEGKIKKTTLHPITTPEQQKNFTEYITSLSPEKGKDIAKLILGEYQKKADNNEISINQSVKIENYTFEKAVNFTKAQGIQPDLVATIFGIPMAVIGLTKKISPCTTPRSSTSTPCSSSGQPVTQKNLTLPVLKASLPKEQTDNSKTPPDSPRPILQLPPICRTPSPNTSPRSESPNTLEALYIHLTNDSAKLEIFGQLSNHSYFNNRIFIATTELKLPQHKQKLLEFLTYAAITAPFIKIFYNSTKDFHNLFNENIPINPNSSSYIYQNTNQNNALKIIEINTSGKNICINYNEYTLFKYGTAEYLPIFIENNPKTADFLINCPNLEKLAQELWNTVQKTEKPDEQLLKNGIASFIEKNSNKN